MDPLSLAAAGASAQGGGGGGGASMYDAGDMSAESETGDQLFTSAFNFKSSSSSGLSNNTTPLIALAAVGAIALAVIFRGGR